MKSRIISIALTQLGQKEFTEGENPDILKYFDYMIVPFAARTQKTPWCTAFLSWCLKTAGYCYSKELDARSYLDVGFSTALPQRGDIAVLWRESPNSWKGHVGFVMNQTESSVFLLGGNQDNSVSIKEYPKSRVLSYRVPYLVQ